MYKEKLIAECEGREWTPSAEPAISSNSLNQERFSTAQINLPDKKANEDYFEVFPYQFIPFIHYRKRMGAANSTRRDDVPPSQGRLHLDI